MLRYFQPFRELVLSEDGFQLRGRVIVNGFHFRSSVVLRETVVVAQVAYFLILGINDRFDFHLLIIRKVESLGKLVNCKVPSHAALAMVGWWIRWWRVCGIIGAQRQIPREQVAGYQRGDEHRFRNFHKLCWFCFIFKFAVPSGTA